MQSVRRQQNESHEDEKSVPPCAARWRGNRMLFVRPIFLLIQTADPAQHRQQNEKKCADAVEPQMDGFAAENTISLPIPRRTGRQNPDSGSERGNGAKERAQ